MSGEDSYSLQIMNEGLLKIIDRLKVDINIVGYQLSGLEVKRSYVGLKVLGSESRVWNRGCAPLRSSILGRNSRLVFLDFH